MLWAHLPKDAKNFVAFDLTRLKQSPIGEMTAFIKSYVENIGVNLKSGCGWQELDGIARISITFTEDDFGAAAIETTLPAKNLVECVAREKHQDTTLLNGLTAFDADGAHTFVAATANLLIVASKRAINDRLIAQSGRPNVLVDGRLAYGELNDGSALPFSIAPATFSLASTASMTELVLHAVMTDERASRKAKEAFADFLGDPKLPKSVASALSFDVKGDNLTAAFRVKGNETEQRAVFADITNMARDSVATYLTSAKSAEAKSTVGMMGKDAVVWFESERLDPKTGKVHHATECPRSAPLTPAVVPRGMKYQSKPSDWTAPGWQDLSFQMDMPQYYSYGVDRSKDGKTCTFYAVGDLNGDGKTSRFQYQAHITKDAKGRTIMLLDPSLKESDPGE